MSLSVSVLDYHSNSGVNRYLFLYGSACNFKGIYILITRTAYMLVLK